MIQSLEYHITNHCNLNCAGCSHFSPLCEPWIETFEEFKRDWNRVCGKGLEIKRIRILGGEPLLNPNLGIMLKYLRALFPKSDINVVTNGILLKQKKAELLPIFIENDISLTVSIYPGLKIDYIDVLNGFPKIEVYDKAGFWNISLHTGRDYDEAQSFYSCFSGSIAKCNFLKDGRIYPCCVIPNLPHFINYYPELKDTGLGKLDIEECGITVEDHTVEEIEKFLNSPCPACAFCNTERAMIGHPWKRTNYDIKEWTE